MFPNQSFTTDNNQMHRFFLWKSLSYTNRLIIAYGCILIGLTLQVWLTTLLPGFLLIIPGALLLTAGGADNSGKESRSDTNSHWLGVSREKLRQFQSMHFRLLKWNKGRLEITTATGILAVFALIVVPVFYLLTRFNVAGHPFFLILVCDLPVLLSFLWITDYQRKPKYPATVSKKLSRFEKLWPILEKRLPADQFHYSLLLPTDDSMVPQDLRIRINCRQLGQWFWGIHGILDFDYLAKKKNLPFFYLTLSAEKGFGLENLIEGLQADAYHEIELKTTDEGEYLHISPNRSLSWSAAKLDNNQDDTLKICLEALERLKRVKGVE